MCLLGILLLSSVSCLADPGACVSVLRVVRNNVKVWDNQNKESINMVRMTSDYLARIADTQDVGRMYTSDTLRNTSSNLSSVADDYLSELYNVSNKTSQAIDALEDCLLKRGTR